MDGETVRSVRRAAAIEVIVFVGVILFPNPFLAPLAVGFGILASWLYRRQPNLLVMGLCHAAVGFTLTHALPLSLTWGMRVGPGVFTM